MRWWSWPEPPETAVSSSSVCACGWSRSSNRVGERTRRRTSGRSRRVAKQVGQPLYAWYIPLWEGFEAHLSGDLDGLLRCAEEVARIGRQAESRNAETLAYVQQLWVAVERLQAAGKLASCARGSAIWPS